MTNILIVDDDINVLRLVNLLLTEAGYNVYQAQDGIKALNILSNNKCDLAVVDVMMPFMDGYALTKEIRNEYDIPIVLLTAKNQIEDKEQGFQSGTDDYLVKPFEPKELLFRIKALLRRYDNQPDESIVRVGHTKYNKLDGSIEISLKEREKSIIVSFQDTGIGLNQKEIERIFDRFYRVDIARTRSVEGTGLGLSIVDTIVKMHGGHINVKSKEKEGTTFVVELPIA